MPYFRIWTHIILVTDERKPLLVGKVEEVLHQQFRLIAMEDFRVLAINPGSTSTKIAVYQGTKSIFLKNIKHSSEDLKQFCKITDQFEFRKEIILRELDSADINVETINAIVGRGGLIHPIESGVYIVSEKMKEDLRIGVMGEHASNLGGLIADDIAKSLPNTKAYIADPVVVDEMQAVARISGHPKFERVSIFHDPFERRQCYYRN